MYLSIVAFVLTKALLTAVVCHALNVTVTPGPVVMVTEKDNLTLSCLVSQRKRSNSVLILRWFYSPIATTPQDSSLSPSAQDPNQFLIAKLGIKKIKLYGNYTRRFPRPKFRLLEEREGEVFRLWMFNVTGVDQGLYSCRVQEIRKLRDTWRASSNGTGGTQLMEGVMEDTEASDDETDPISAPDWSSSKSPGTRKRGEPALQNLQPGSEDHIPGFSSKSPGSKGKKRPWTVQEVNAVEETLMDNIQSGKVPVHFIHEDSSGEGLGQWFADVYLCAVLICSLGLLSIFLFTLVLTCQYFYRRHRLKTSYLLVKCPESSSGETVTSSSSSSSCSPKAQRKDTRPKIPARTITPPKLPSEPPPHTTNKVPVAAKRPQKPKRSKLLQQRAANPRGLQEDSLTYAELELVRPRPDPPTLTSVESSPSNSDTVYAQILFQEKQL